MHYVRRHFGFVLDVVDYLTTLGTLDLTSLSKEAEEQRVKLLQELVDILSTSPDGLVNGNTANGGSMPDVGNEDVAAEDYEVPTTLQSSIKVEEMDRVSTASMEKKNTSKGNVTRSRSNVDVKSKKKTLTRTKSSPVVDLPSQDARKKEGNLIEKKLMRRTVQHWAVLGSDTLYLAKSSTDTQSESKVRSTYQASFMLYMSLVWAH